MARQANEAWFAVNQLTQAQMAELVDALGSGPNARKGVEVRVFFWAPVFLIHFYLLFFFDSFFGYLLWQQSRVSFFSGYLNIDLIIFYCLHYFLTQYFFFMCI